MSKKKVKQAHWGFFTVNQNIIKRRYPLLHFYNPTQNLPKKDPWIFNNTDLKSFRRHSSERSIASAVVELAARAGAGQRVRNSGAGDGVDEGGLASSFKVKSCYLLKMFYYFKIL